MRGVFASSPTIALGAGQAIADNNFIDKVVLVGFDSEDKLVKFVKQATSSNSYTMKWQKKGDTASGVVVERRASTISIDITPCSTEKETVTFIKPYIESKINDVNCGQETHQQSQVIQQ